MGKNMTETSSKQFERRAKKLWKLTSRDIDGMFVTSPENVFYLSGFSGTEGSVILTKSGGFFLTDGRYTTQAKQQVNNLEIITFSEKWKETGRLIKKLKIKSLGYESENLTAALLSHLEKEVYPAALKSYSTALSSLRFVKEAGEIKMLKKAALIASESLRSVIPLIKPGVMETEIAAELEYQMKIRGGSNAAFQTIVASGCRSALPHGVASTKKIEKGDFVTIDYGIIYHGYCSDETCTFIVGRPTKKQKKVYETVKKAHDLAVKAVKVGISLAKIDAVARNHIDMAGYKKYFNHGTGHGVGLCVHEPPVVSFRTKQKVLKGMVFTIEPGIYLPGWGGVRIEDTVLVKQEGCDLITQSDKSLDNAVL